jgi:hypothetical protein
MATPGHTPPPVSRSVDTYTPGRGRFRTPSTSATTANIPFVGPTQLIGVGFAPFTINVHGGSGKVTVPFANLPSGGGASLAQALQQSGVATSIRSGYSLIFVVALQQSNAPNGVVFSVTPRAVDSSGVVATTSMLGSRSFRTFQAVVQYQQHISAAQSTVTGTVTGQLLLASRSGARGGFVIPATGTPIESVQ